MSLDYPHTTRYVNHMPARATPEIPSGAARRQEAKQETRHRLILAAREAFSADGLDGPSLDAICERAGFTRGAFYVHFRSREELVEAVVDHTLRDFVDVLLAGAEQEGGLADTIRRYAELASLVWNDPAAATPPGPGQRFDTLMAAAHRNPRIAETLRDALGMARGRLEESVAVAERTGRAAQVGAREIANLLLLAALGVLSAADLGLPMDVGRTRDALLTLLAPSETTDR